MMEDAAKILLSTLCDDVRLELNGKVSLMGLFDSVTVADPRAVLPPFYIYAKVAVRGEGEHQVVLRIVNETGDFKIELPGTLHAQVVSPLSGLYESTLSLNVTGFQVPQAGLYRVCFVIDGAEFQGPYLHVTLQPPPVG